MRLRSLSALAAFAVLAALTLSVSASGAEGTETQQYIVRMLEKPVAAYEGGTAGIPATKPHRGKRIDNEDPNVRQYEGYLKGTHAELASSVGAEKVYDYSFAVNGFAAELTEAQAKALRGHPSVVSVEKERMLRVDTSNTPSFMGLTGPTGAWSTLGGMDKAGEDVVIGIVDTGIAVRHPSFQDQATKRFGFKGQDAGVFSPYAPLKTWSRKDRCVEGEGFKRTDCNNKLVGAQYFVEGFGVDRVAERDFLSPRDWNGHGSHTASTAGGNHSIRATGDAAQLGTVSGMAPRARIAMYKVCWEEEVGDGGCSSIDSVAAIDKAVADGVDVINFSISGTRTNYLDSVEVAFLFAAEAGVFVAASAGNEGPGNFTVAHPSPWISTVAAGTHSRRGSATVTLGGSGGTFTGASLTNAVGPASLVYAGNVTKAGEDPADAALCVPGTLDPAAVAGKIVHCDRGVIALVDKAAAVKEAGGAGAIIGNVPGGATNTLGLLHVVPTVHVGSADATAIKAYIASAGAGATAALSAATLSFDNPSPLVAGFSSRGPSLAGGEDIMKPDFMAPGEDILAAVAPEGNFGRDFDLYSGTSMSSPHVAGFGALLTHAHPDWSPAAMRSALATTATPLAGSAASGIFNAGSGHVNPTAALDPGLVYDAGFGDYLMFLQGQHCACLPPSFPAIDASDLNQPSIAIGGLAGQQTVTRTVTNVSGSTSTYTAALTAPAGFTVTVDPMSFTIAPGETKTYTVSFTRTDAPFGTRRPGQLVWSDGTHSVRSPIIVAAAPVAAPAQLNLSGTSGTTEFEIKPGWTGALGYAERGLIEATETAGNVLDDPTNNFDTGDPDGNQGFTRHDFTVPAGTKYARWSLFDANTDGADDLDLYVYRVNGDGSKTLVAASGTGTSAEEANLVAPAAATYQAYVHGWQTEGPDANYTLFSWILDDTDAGNMTATGPATATIGVPETVELSWSGLTAGKKYLGQVAYLEGTTEHGSSIVRIDG
jgi:hypothetical protein